MAGCWLWPALNSSRELKVALPSYDLLALLSDNIALHSIDLVLQPEGPCSPS